MKKLGIDLATKNIGLVLLDEKNLICNKTTIKLNSFNAENLFSNVEKLLSELKLFIGNESGLMVGIELSNHSNPKMTQKFSFYAGIIYIVLAKRSSQIKFFNSNQWQTLIGCLNQDERQVRKAKAKSFVYENANWKNELDFKDDWTEDEADAYCIAYTLEQLEDTETISNEVKQRRKQKKQLENSISKMRSKIITRLNKIKELDKVKNKKLIDRLEKEVAEIENNIQILKEKIKN